MKNHSQILTYFLPLIVAGLTLSACQKDQHPGAATAAPKTPVLGGTGDVGGGNGINNRVFESYRVDVTQLEAFKTVLQPIFDLQKQDKPQTSEEKENNRKQMANYKTWYILPIKLKPIDNSVLGLSFTDDRTEQLAIQTKNEVWINKEAWDKMNVQQQGDLLMHEFMMMVYMFKFEEGKTLCSKYFNLSQQVCDIMAKTEPFKNPPEKARPLNEDDYQNIRSATAYFLSLKTPYSGDELNAKLASLGFDSRLFRATNPQGEKFDESLDRRLTQAEAWDLFKRGIERGVFESKCTSNMDQRESEFPCEFQLQAGDFSKNFDPAAVPNLDLFYQWKLATASPLQGYIGARSTTSVSAFYGIDSATERVEWYSAFEIQWGEKKMARTPGEKYFDVMFAVRKTTANKRLQMEPVGIIVLERVYHGSIDIKSGENFSWKCHNASSTLNSSGERNYILVKAKNANLDNDISTFLNYYQDLDCESAKQIGTEK